MMKRSADDAKRRRRRPGDDDRGMTAVEFAFLTPVIFVILMATVQFAVFLYAKQAAQSAVRYADRKVREEAGVPGCMSPDKTQSWQDEADNDATDRARNIAGSILTNPKVSVTMNPDNSVDGVCPATVTVTMQATVPQILFIWGPDSVKVSATGPVEQFVRHP